MVNNMKLFCCKTMMDEIEAIKPREPTTSAKAGLIKKQIPTRSTWDMLKSMAKKTPE